MDERTSEASIFRQPHDDPRYSQAEGSAVNRKRVQRLMRLMKLESTVPKPSHHCIASAGTNGIPLSTEESDGYSDQSGVSRRHHIYLAKLCIVEARGRLIGYRFVRAHVIGEIEVA